MSVVSFFGVGTGVERDDNERGGSVETDRMEGLSDRLPVDRPSFTGLGYRSYL